MMSTPSRQYATDVTDVQWRRIEPLLPASTWQPNGPGRPPRDRRQIVNGALPDSGLKVSGRSYSCLTSGLAEPHETRLGASGDIQVRFIVRTSYYRSIGLLLY